MTMASLNKLFTNILLIGLAINIVIYLFGVFKVDPQVTMPFTDLSTWQAWFPNTWADVLFTGAAIAGITIASLLLRSNTYAIYALLIAAVGVIIKPVGSFVIAFPMAIGSWLPKETNPIYPLPNPITVVLTVVTTFAAFWFIFGFVIQRDPQ